MSLIKCTECGKMISDKASACVGCGAPISYDLSISNAIEDVRKRLDETDSQINSILDDNEKLVLSSDLIDAQMDYFEVCTTYIQEHENDHTIKILNEYMENSNQQGDDIDFEDLYIYVKDKNIDQTLFNSLKNAVIETRRVKTKLNKINNTPEYSEEIDAESRAQYKIFLSTLKTGLGIAFVLLTVFLWYAFSTY